MTMRRMIWSGMWRWLGLGVSLGLTACVSKLTLDGSPCPCPVAGFVCCSSGAGQRCVRSLVGETGDQTCSRSNLDAGGMGDSGAGGAGPPAPDAMPIGLQQIQSIAIGRAHACASYGEFQIACMGDNSKGQATPPPGLYAGITAGDDFTCASKRDTVDPSKDGLVVCWGDNTYGQATPPPGTKWVIAGGRHACGGGDTGPTVCWGDNSSGQATLPSGISTVVALGRRHSCTFVFDADAAYPPAATIRCWGDNSRGQTTPPPVSLFNAPIGSLLMQASGDHTCATSGVATYCWGDNDQTPWVPPPFGVLSLAVTPGHACGITNFDRTIRCWGNDWGNAKPQPPPGQFFSVWAGEFINCAGASDGSALCWGSSYEIWPQ
jgi:hypothetical protein